MKNIINKDLVFEKKLYICTHKIHSYWSEKLDIKLIELMNELTFTTTNPNPLVEKSYLFSIKIVQTVKSLQKDQKEFILSKQLIRSGTSIGALIFEGQFAQSQADFINKLSISLKEANETKYWIFLLKDTEYIETDLFSVLLNDVNELIKILVCSIKTTKNNLKK